MRALIKRNRHLTLLALFGLLMAGSWGLTQLPAWRVDLTQEQLYSLSDGSRALTQSLSTPLSLSLYFSSSLAQALPQLKDYDQRIFDLLQEYQSLNPSVLQVRRIDPEPFSDAEDSAVLAGLQGAPVSLGGDTFYMGLVGENTQGEQKVIAFFSPERERFLEYEISQLIYGLTEPAKTRVGVISGLSLFGGFDFATRQSSGPWVVIEQLQALHDVVDLGTELRQIDEVDVLLLVQPQQLSEATRYAIDQYVLGGGRALVFVDPHAEVAAQQGGNSSSDLPVLLEAWGVDYQPEKILGDSRWGLRVAAAAGQAPVPHVGIIGLQSSAFDPDSIITTGLESLNVASAGVLKPSASASQGLRFTPLLRSSVESSLFSATAYKANRDHGELLADFIADDQRHVIAAQIQGPAVSVFAAAPPAPVQDTDANKLVSETNSEPTIILRPHLSASKGDINLLVVADVDLLSDRLWVQVSDFFGQRVASPWANNGDFVVNAVENLAGSEQLIALRSRGQYARPFTRVDELRSVAAESFKQQEQLLVNRLADLEASITAMNPMGDPAMTGSVAPALSDAQVEEVAAFELERLQVRKQLRQVQRQLNQSIDQLESRLQWLNTALVPALLIMLMLALQYRRRRLAY